MRLVAALSLCAFGCFARVPVEDGRPLFVNAMHVEDRDAQLLASLPIGAAYWEACGARFVTDRASAAYVIDVELVDDLPSNHAGEWYTDGVWTRMRLSRAVLNSFNEEWRASAIAHEFGHAFGLEHLGADAVMSAPLEGHPELTAVDRAAFRALTGRACLAPRPTSQTDRGPRGSDF